VGEFLQHEGLLPAIYFIFSRAGCDAAAARVVDHRLRLTTADEASEIRRVAEARTAHLSPADLAVLGYGRWLHDLEAGVAPHHAGLVPAFKETTERLFAAGLVKLVFATETLALGINMPARTVVLESLSKFTGDGHELLQAGDYTQLTGRAGRRGIDTRGTAVVLHSRYEQFDSIAGIAAAGSHPLRSAFEPTYNMTANLVAAYPRERAEELLNASFAQFRRDRARRGLEDALQEEEAALAAERERAECHLGDVASLAGSPRTGAALAEFAGATAAGDVLSWDSGKRRVLRVVVARGHGKRPRVLAIDLQGDLHRMAPEDLPAGVVLAGRIDLPRPYEPRRPAYRRKVAALLRTWSPPDEPLLRPGDTGTGDPGPAACPDLPGHLAALRSIPRRERQIASLRRRIGSSGKGLVPQLRAILALLQRRGYASDWTLSAAGERLRFIYNELDLLLAEALAEGLFTGLEPAEAAALASAFTFEPRRDAAAGYWPTAALAERWDRLESLWRGLADEEEAARLAVTRPPEAGFGEIAYRWASGAALGSLFDDEAGGVGDFVRNCRQLIDLLRQIRDVAPETRETVDAALAAIDRGVVAAAGAL
jgi:ATP-dependent RNA helicase HelY